MTTSDDRGQPPDDRDEVVLEEELRVLGLSDTEIATYLALLSRGEATTSTVSEDAGVTQRAIYDIAERLENRGLVRVNDHASPTTIRAVPPDEAISSLSARLESMTPALDERYNEIQPQAPEIQMVKSRRTALKHLQNSISQATSEIAVAVPEHVFPSIEQELRAAVERGVLVFLLIGKRDPHDGDAQRFAGVADVVRCWSESLPLVYAVDGESAMVGSANILASTQETEDAVSVSETGLAGAILGLYLSAYWPAATEVFVTEPCSLPRTFAWFRQATLHAVLHQHAGTDLWADVETDDGERITGWVTEVRQALVEPGTNDFTLETSLCLETDDGVVSVGGPGSFIEDYEATSVTLRVEP
ncbi:TrmB family transcriptional regulator [Natronomonas sp. EA1]|uniref:TrmB family transcriptional regulator n=1 Tax=Natronomonas sp. EA1 TaxID=3421655 RepID=UPI003EBD8577